MIFVCTGTQVYQFNRLIMKMDELVSSGLIQEKVFAQIGASDYLPEHFEYSKFLTPEEFCNCQNEARLIISHGGTGALIGASKKGKNLIAVPRLKEFGEHTDDHQLQIVSVLEKEGYIRAVYEIDDLGKTIEDAISQPITKKYNRESHILEIIEDFISKH